MSFSHGDMPGDDGSRGPAPLLHDARRAPRAARWLAPACGAVAALAGGAYLLFWSLGLPPRWSVLGVITVKTNMALAQVLAGGALAALGGGSRRRAVRGVAAGAATVVLGLGLATLAEHLLGVDLGVDQLLATEPPGAPATTSPNRMGLAGSVCLTLVGAGLLALWRGARAYRWVGGATACVVLVPAVGWVYGIGQLYADARVTAIAWPTVVALLALAAGLVVADPGDGTVPLFWRDDAGGELLRRILPPAVLAPLLVGWLRLQGERAGLYGRYVGTGLLVVSLSVGFGLLLWYAAHRLSGVARERARAEQDQARLAAIVESTDAAIVSTDLAGEVLTWNAGAERLLGWRAEEVVGRPVEVILPVDRRGEELAIVERVSAGEVVAPFETRRLTSTGEEIDVSVVVSPIRGRDGRIVGASKVLRDVTALKRAERALREANEQLREADRRKDEFLGMLSHELRNPLAPVRNALHLLDRVDPRSEQARRAREIANRQLTHLTRLVDDLLDVTRVVRGKLQLHRRDVDLAAVAHRTADDHRDLLRERGLELAVEAPPDALVVHADETRMAQVIGNLLHNAAKFTPAGGRVTLSLAREGGDAVVRVRDTGAGIEPAVLASLFQPFVQARQTLARTEGGLGLGLALARGLIALHGGEASASSAGPGLGAEFTFRLPLAASASAAAPEPSAATGPSAAGRRRRVLVVDDNRDAAETLAELVTLFGHDPEVAFDGPSALAAAAARPPEVVLCDLGLPGMDGYAVARALRAGVCARSRLVAVSGYALPDDVARSAAAGFDAHVAKPPDPAVLEAVLSGPAPAEAAEGRASAAGRAGVAPTLTQG